MKMPTAIDLFCGCGGLTRGLRDAGFRVLAGVEVDPLAIASYRMNHRSTVVWTSSITEIEPREMMDRHKLKTGDLDLLAGCPPCQGFSSIRRLNGSRRIIDKRKDLVFRFLDFVTEMLPKTIMIENVPRLAVDWRMKSGILPGLRKLGYVGTPAVLNAADYNVPQRRRRMVFIASRVGEIEYAKEAGVLRTVRDAIGGLPRPSQSNDELHNIPEKRSKEVMDIIKRIPKNGGSRRNLGREYQLDCHIGENRGFNDVYGRMSWDAVAPTITGGCVNPSKGRFLHPSQNRAITLREAALLQGFPEDYKFSLENGKYAVARMIGNAFPPAFAAAHAAVISRYLRKGHR